MLEDKKTTRERQKKRRAEARRALKERQKAHFKIPPAKKTRVLKRQGRITISQLAIKVRKPLHEIMPTLEKAGFDISSRLDVVDRKLALAVLKYKPSSPPAPSKRLHEAAKSLNIPAKELIQKLREQGVEISHPFSVLHPGLAQVITPAPKPKRILLIRAVAVALIAVGLLILLYPLYTNWTYQLFQARLTAKSSSSGRQAKLKAKDYAVAIPKGTLAKLVIPKIDLATFVLEGTTQEVLVKGPGHYEETPVPGEDGNVCIAGHRTLYGRPFARLDELKPGDRIMLFTSNQALAYRVIEKKVVSPKDLSVIRPTEENRLTLTACHPLHSAARRLVIVAHQVKVKPNYQPLTVGK